MRKGKKKSFLNKTIREKKVLYKRIIELPLSKYEDFDENLRKIIERSQYIKNRHKSYLEKKVKEKKLDEMFYEEPFLWVVCGSPVELNSSIGFIKKFEIFNTFN